MTTRTKVRMGHSFPRCQSLRVIPLKDFVEQVESVGTDIALVV